jgi:hypothetical protein
MKKRRNCCSRAITRRYELLGLQSHVVEPVEHGPRD